MDYCAGGKVRGPDQGGCIMGNTAGKWKKIGVACVGQILEANTAASANIVSEQIASGLAIPAAAALTRPRALRIMRCRGRSRGGVGGGGGELCTASCWWCWC